MTFTPAQSSRVLCYQELKEERARLNAGVKKLDDEMERLKALIVADMGGSYFAVCDGGSCTVSFKPSQREGITKDGLLRLKEVHPDIYDEYASVSVSHRFSVKFAAAEAVA